MRRKEELKNGKWKEEEEKEEKDEEEGEEETLSSYSNESPNNLP